MHTRRQHVLYMLLTLLAITVAGAAVFYININSIGVQDAKRVFLSQFTSDADRFADFFSMRVHALKAAADAISTHPNSSSLRIDAGDFARVGNVSLAH